MSTEATLIMDQLETANLDNRQFQLFWLKNGVELVLIRDAQTDKASISVNVKAGSFFDKTPGTAHAVMVSTPRLLWNRQWMLIMKSVGC